jgi:hypothetical protein
MRKPFRTALGSVVLGGALGWIPTAWGQEATLPSEPVPVLPAIAVAAGAQSPQADPGGPATLPAPMPVPIPAYPPLPPPPGPPGPGPSVPGLLPPPEEYVPPPAVVVRRCDPLGVWFDMDYLLWWTKSGHVQPLTTAGIASDAGVLGPANPATLFGGGDVESGDRSGGRFILGFWFTDNQVLGLEGSYYFLAQHSVAIATGLQDSSAPDAPPGLYHATLANNLQSADVNLLANVTHIDRLRFTALGGFRFLQLDERLHVQQNFVSADLSELDTWDDEVQTRNHFYGGQLGGRLEYRYARFYFDLIGKVALGATNQKITLGGGITQTTTSTGFDSFGNPIQNVQVARATDGGLVVQPAAFSRDYFTVVPEMGFNVGYQFTSFLRATGGYTFLYWSSVVRAGDQVNGVPKATGFWAQGLNLGLDFNF